MRRDGYDVAVVGAGIVGLATARAIGMRTRSRVVVLEREKGIARHQTGNNSGVVHSGLYYRPGSAKAETCVAGRKALYELCAARGVPYEQCGKVVVATRDEERRRLDDLYERGVANGLSGIRRLAAEEITEHEPHTRGVAGLLVPETGIVDYVAVAEVFADDIRDAGGDIVLGAGFERLVRENGGLVVETTSGRIRCRTLVNCSGLQSDRIARRCGLDPGLRIVPFRGEYHELAPRARSLVRNLIYPVPDPRFPFLGVHFTRRIDGSVEAGPNAVLALAREGYSWTRISPRDLLGTVTHPGMWRLAARYWRIAAGEVHRSLSRSATARALRELVPALEDDDLLPGGAGVRAQALAPDGTLVDDFRIVEAPDMIHVLNAPSPAATASIAIGEQIADLAATRFGLSRR